MRPIAPPLFVPAATTLSQAHALMQTNGVGSVAVVDLTGKLIGFLQNGTLRARKS
jgi:CBS domain-containing protein